MSNCHLRPRVTPIKHLFRFNWQSYNFDAYGLPQESPPPGKMLLYPIEVRIIKQSNLNFLIIKYTSRFNKMAQ